MSVYFWGLVGGFFGVVWRLGREGVWGLFGVIKKVGSIWLSVWFGKECYYLVIVFIFDLGNGDIIRFDYMFLYYRIFVWKEDLN